MKWAKTISALALSLIGGATMAQQNYIKLVVPFPPGDALETATRVLADLAKDELGRQIVIDNRPGASGFIAADNVARSTDGTTFLLGTTAMLSITPYLKKAPYDPADLTPIAQVAEITPVFSVQPSLPANSWQDFVTLARANPGKYTYASAGNGTSIHLAGELFTSMAGVDLLHVPYKGSGPAMTELLGGQVDYMFDSITSAKPHIDSGKLTAIAVTTSKRSTALHAFLDMLARRSVGLYAKAGAKYRPTRNAEPTARALLAAIGMGTPHHEGRMKVPPEDLLFHAGNLASRTRSAERLRAMLEAETGRRVEIEEFAGGYIRLPATEQTRMPRGRGPVQHAALGVSAVAGAQVWDPHARFIIRFGPLTRQEFEALLPGTPAWLTVTQLARLFVGPDTSFAVNLVLKKEEVPPARTGGGARLGWSSWSGTSRPRTADARDAVFEPREVV